MPAPRAVVQPNLGRRTDCAGGHIQAPVPIQVSYRRAPMAAGGLCGQAGFGGERLKPDAAWVAWNAAEHGVRLLHPHSRRVFKRLNVAARYKYIFVTIVIVIADRNPVVEAHARQAGLGGYVLEVTLAVVFEEPVGVLGRGLLQSLNIGAVGEKDIQIAVVVVVEN